MQLIYFPIYNTQGKGTVYTITKYDFKREHKEEIKYKLIHARNDALFY